MNQINGSDYDDRDSLPEEEDEFTLAALEEGIRAANEGRLVPHEEVQRR